MSSAGSPSGGNDRPVPESRGSVARCQEPFTASPTGTGEFAGEPREGIVSSLHRSNSALPEELPRYRVLTGPDDDAFCRRVSAALDAGYLLYGSPAATFDGRNVIVAQALIWPKPSTATRSRPRAEARARRR
jgi:hypothetical protein